MSHPRHTLVLLIAGLLLVTSTGAISTASVQRGIDVAVVDDQHAFLGVELYDQELHNGRSTEAILTVENRLNEDITVRTSVDGQKAGKPPKLLGVEDESEVELAPGESATVDAILICSAVDGKPVHRTETWPVTIEAVGESIRSELDRSLTVECNGRPPAHAAANGSQANRGPGSSAGGTGTTTSTG